MNTLHPNGIEVIVAALILNDKNQVLLRQSPKWKDGWSVLGAQALAGSTIADTIKKEVKAKLGVDCEVIAQISASEQFISNKAFKHEAHFIYLEYVVRPLSYDFKIDNSDVLDIKWFDVNDAVNNSSISEFTKKTMPRLNEWINSNAK